MLHNHWHLKINSYIWYLNVMPRLLQHSYPGVPRLASLCPSLHIITLPLFNSVLMLSCFLNIVKLQVCSHILPQSASKHTKACSHASRPNTLWKRFQLLKQQSIHSRSLEVTRIDPVHIAFNYQSTVNYGLILFLHFWWHICTHIGWESIFFIPKLH